MQTEDKLPLDVSVIITLDEGCINDPMLFIDKSKAKRAFIDLVVEKGFRSFNPMEKFKDYQDAFWKWEDSSNCTYNRMNWEIHIWL